MLTNRLAYILMLTNYFAHITLSTNRLKGVLIMVEFVLKKFPQILDDLSLDYQTHNAEKVLYKYDGMVEFIYSPEILTTLLFYQESVMSSRLEGTVATITDILNFKVGKEVSDQIGKDATEIENYKDALGYCITQAEAHDFQITNSLIKNIQYILLNNSRGKDKLKGEFKKRQNYIGNKYNNEITYTPVSHLHTEEYMTNLVGFMNEKNDNIHPLIKVAIIHAYFELIHPFEDGNGRVGRILVPLLLKKYNVLTTPYFYISYYLSQNRDRYISSLEAISKDLDWKPWISFFIEALQNQTETLINMLRRLKEIRVSAETKINELKSQFSIQIINFLFKRIKFTTTKFIEETRINPSTARVLLKQMEQLGIIEVEERGTGQAPSIYRFKDLYIMIEEISI